MAFVLQEHIELLLHDGGVPVGALVAPTFVAGLVLQAPFALVGYLVARALLRLADGLRCLVIRGTEPRGSALRAVSLPPPDGPPRALRWAPVHSGRAPPAAATTG
jgi:hypothetical protein